MLKCTINGQEVEVKDGSTIIEAFKLVEKDIAHYCWHPGLSIAGVCRLCMVEVEGNPRMQLACNTPVQEGMVVRNDTQQIKDTVKWGLDFHLINHPLDCPICDQAGECGLQEQYMKFGEYDSEMAERKIKKHKVVDLGSKIVLDSERCILCSRCVRFTDEVSKTHELGIFNRGNRSEIGVFDGKPLENDYALNTVDICPVGALTSKDFRFRQRVWYLKNAETVCNGCSTGCNVKTYYNEEGFFRVKPTFNEEVNGHWMCDKGRDIYKYSNLEFRQTESFLVKGSQVEKIDPIEVLKKLGEELKSNSKTALVLSGHNTNEEYAEALTNLSSLVGDRVYHWWPDQSRSEEFDGLLIRGDKAPNTKGLLNSLKDAGVSAKKYESLTQDLASGEVETVLFVAPDNYKEASSNEELFNTLNKAQRLVWLGSQKDQALESIDAETYIIPQRTHVEKSGSFTNFNGLTQKFKPVTTIVKPALDLIECSSLLSGKDVDFSNHPAKLKGMKINYFTTEGATL